MIRRLAQFGTAAMLTAATAVILTSGTVSSGATAATVHTRTLVGTDFLPLESQVSREFVSGTGGGIYPVVANGLPRGYALLEANVTLPVRANITSVSFYYQDCGQSTPAGVFAFARYYFGSYKPSAGSYADALPPASSQFGNCQHLYTFTRSRTRIATVTADRRYVLGILTTFDSSDWSRAYPGWVISGARVQWTCPKTCGP